MAAPPSYHTPLRVVHPLHVLLAVLRQERVSTFPRGDSSLPHATARLSQGPPYMKRSPSVEVRATVISTVWSVHVTRSPHGVVEAGGARHEV